MTPEQTLHALFAAETPSARDYVFQASVAERIARRRAWAAVAAMAPWALAAVAVLWALAPAVVELAGPLGESLAPAAAILACIGLVTAALLRGAPRLRLRLRRT